MNVPARYFLWMMPLLGLLAAAAFVWSRFDKDIQSARARVARGSLLIATRCGPIEYQEAGTGVPLLAIHGSGGGYDQDSGASKHLGSAPLKSIRAPALIISARDGRYGTFASAQYAAGQIAGAKFIGFDRGGHTWVGHDDEIHAEIVKLLAALPMP